LSHANYNDQLERKDARMTSPETTGSDGRSRTILAHVDVLVAEEHQLRSGEPVTAEQRSRLGQIERDLDQCWDLLRQRRARLSAGQDPDLAQPRPIAEVESYLE